MDFDQGFLYKNYLKFCDVDDFCKNNSITQQTLLLTHNRKRRNRKKSLPPSEMMTILVYFHASNYKNFKALLITIGLSQTGIIKV